MHKKGLKTLPCLLLLIMAIIAAGPVPVYAWHSVLLNVPDHSEEALDWCGPATGQMCMDGYPGGSCPKLQEDIEMAIQSYKTETMWDTDPAGLAEAMSHMCPAGHWVVFNNSNAQALMYSTAYWMTKLKFPAAALLNTLPHNAYTAHGEHWVAVRGFITDKDPTLPGNTSVSLQYVWFNDPSPDNLGDPSIERFVSGSTWYTLFQTVTKPGSTYLGKYVAVVEPPIMIGRAIAPVEVVSGTIIPPEEALRYAQKWIAELKLADLAPYRALKTARPLTPLLVNGSGKAYYLIHFVGEANLRASAAILINAYNGSLQEAGAFRSAPLMTKNEAVKLAQRHVGVKKIGRSSAEAITIDNSAAGRYFPVWKVIMDNRAVTVGHDGKIVADYPTL